MGSFPSPEQLRTTYHTLEEFLDSIRPTVDGALKLDDAASLRTLADSLDVEVARLAKPSKELERLRAKADCVVSRKPPELMELEGDWVVDIIVARVEELISWIGRRSEFMALKKKHAQEPPVFKETKFGGVIKRKVSAETKRFQYFDRMQQKENDATTPPQWTSVAFLKQLHRVLTLEEAFLNEAIQVSMQVPKARKKKDIRERKTNEVIFAALCQYHNYGSNVAPHYEAVESRRELARRIDPQNSEASERKYKSAVSKYFKTCFKGGFGWYKQLCHDRKIIIELQKMAGEDPMYEPKGGEMDTDTRDKDF